MTRPPQTAAPQAPETVARMVELRASANLMLLEAGLYCLFQQPGLASPPEDGSGLPGVRVTLPPHANGAGRVTIQGLHADGWLGPRDGATLVRVEGGAAQVLVTVYQSPTHAAETAPRLKVVRLEPEPMAPAASPAQPAARPAPAAAPAAESKAAESKVAADVVAHMQRAGDRGVAFGEWMGTRGSKQWVEGFGLAAIQGVAPEEIEYQAVLGRGWLSPWIEAGKFCGSRGMALPLLGFNLRLRGAAAAKYDCAYAASFTDGTQIGPLAAGQSCEAPSLAPLEAFRIDLRPKGTAAKPAAVARAAAPKASPVKAATKAQVKAPPKPTAKAKPAAKAPAKPVAKAAAKKPAKRAAAPTRKPRR